jgi:hypothetical protein
VSRRTHSRGICGSTFTVVDFPFRVKIVAMVSSPSAREISYNKWGGIWK